MVTGNTVISDGLLHTIKILTNVSVCPKVKIVSKPNRLIKKLWIQTGNKAMSLYIYIYIYTGSFKIFEHLLLWPPRSPDLTLCNFFLWVYVKDDAYKPQTARSHSSCGANH